MCIASIGCEDNSAHDVGFILDGEDARRCVVVVIVEAADAHSSHAGIGLPVGKQRPSLVPEVTDID